MRRLEIRLRDDLAIAIDERGEPLLITIRHVKNYGKGNVVFLPSEWNDKEVIVLEKPKD